MKKCGRSVGILLALMLAAGVAVMPVGAFAAAGEPETDGVSPVPAAPEEPAEESEVITPQGPYGIAVGSEWVTDENKNNVLNDGSASVVYDSDSNVLTLTDAVVIGSSTGGIYGKGIYSNGSLIINLVGENKITSDTNEGILVEGDLRISSNGSLTVNSYGDGIDAEGALDITDSSVGITSTNGDGIEAAQLSTSGAAISIGVDEAYGAGIDVSGAQNIMDTPITINDEAYVYIAPTSTRSYAPPTIFPIPEPADAEPVTDVQEGTEEAVLH